MKTSTKGRSVIAILAVGMLAGLASLSIIFAAPNDPSHQDGTIQSLNKALSETTDPAMRQSLNEKLRIAQETRDEEVAARSAAPNPSAQAAGLHYLQTQSAIIALTPVIHAAQRAAGAGYIVDEPSPPFPTILYTVQNDWYMDRPDGSILGVWAGASGYGNTNPGHGVLVVRPEKGNPDGPALKPEGGTYFTPVDHGAVKITGATGMVLEVTAADGAVVHFNVATRKWQ